MKRNTLISTHKIFVMVCLFSISFAFSQNTKPANKTLFGKQLKAESVNPKNKYIRCATTEYEKFLQGKDAKRMTDAQFEAWVAPLVSRYKSMKTSSQSGGIITIPVVVHVIHSGQAIGVAPNITDAQVESQITVMNQDYRKLFGSPGYNTNPVGADTQIQFELAKVDPNGNPTNGIDRLSFCQSSWSDVDIDAILKPATIWDPTQYMNMWSVEFTDNTLLGYAQFPDGSGLGGLDVSGGNANSDGVVSNYDVFGSLDYDTTPSTFLLNATYNKGRTMSHEVGHWLGLRHIWGDSACGDDFCADTPKAHDANYGCPSVLDCDNVGNEMVENYMDYTDDACMNIFTQNQKDRMVVIMNNAARRSTLKTSTKNSAIALFAMMPKLSLKQAVPHQYVVLCLIKPHKQ
ncbi:MAG: zinc metalloprotease [Flavobacterium sp.]|uniref:zinc metalloprotease n=1 Tax=Flavobacterium sp. TaxID=239 RepID=UPI00260FE05E|nr:zinc metalloprotease [Flavobacterium sp.]MDD5152010.1 zinc metalloprotease [Flavobacterium sp.]